MDYSERIRELEFGIRRGLRGEAKWKEIVTAVLKERDSIMTELRGSMETINMLRMALDTESSGIQKAMKDKDTEIKVLTSDKVNLEENAEAMQGAIRSYETHSSKMQNHIEGLCNELQVLQKKVSSTQESETAKTEELSREQAERFRAEKRVADLEEEVQKLKDKIETQARDLQAKEERNADLSSQLSKIAGFQQLMADKQENEKAQIMSPRSRIRQKKRASKNNQTIPPEEIHAISYLTAANPSLREVMKRVPLSSKTRHLSDEDAITMDQYKWSSSSLNTARSSILSRFYLPKDGSEW
eukprot:TRINITY_DN16738_c0_g1_i1.p1 TRINITY_DN16738_c0_g1~~TRINITY_DN16738_c0_g1_i1.p1  ORF type:complete len:316 (+),score=59.47 TRINITY_DN16738_c0_g1_i1:49-948(+)